MSDRTEGLEEHQSSLALKICADEEDLDWIGARLAWRWATPFTHIHAGGNDGNLVSRHAIALHKAELCPLRPRNEPARGPEAVAVQAPFQTLKPGRTLLVLIECAQFVILKWRSVERDNAGDFAEPALSKDGRHLRMEEQGIKFGLCIHAGNLTTRAQTCPHRPVAPVDRNPSCNSFGFEVNQSPMRVYFVVEGDVGEKVLGVSDVSESLFQKKSELVTGHRLLFLVTSNYPTRGTLTCDRS